MAKTRIKTTPTRMQKDALMGSTAVTTSVCKPAGTGDALKKRLIQLNQRKSITTGIDLIPRGSTIIVQAPKRTNSISSVTSTLSHISDGQQSDNEAQLPSSSSSSSSSTHSLQQLSSPAPSSASSPPPTPSSINTTQHKTTVKTEEPTMDELTENAIKTLNAGLQSRVMNGRSALAAAIRNRKVFMITEKSDATKGNKDNQRSNMQKRKMYLIMEEENQEDKESSNQEKWMKMDNNGIGGGGAGGCKKLTLFADKCDGQLPQQIERILPEILNRIQAKSNSGGNGGTVPSVGVAGAMDMAAAENDENSKVIILKTTNNEDSNNNNNNNKNNNERLPLTLPPKKNRNKIINTQIIPIIQQQQQHHHHHHNNNDNNNRTQNIITVPSTMSGNSLIYGNNNDIKKSVAATKSTTLSFAVKGNDVDDNESHIVESTGATPVIVAPKRHQQQQHQQHQQQKTATISMYNGNTVINTTAPNSTTLKPSTGHNVTAHKNINLSPDFLFLMKMLPKLESIPEPHKNHLKNCIEQIITQNAHKFGEP